MATVTLQGNTFNTNGELPAVGSNAPDFHLVDA
ncbi:MAG: lipid hydroperoxide peroxidase, partial [Gammaproteobacteria bacterium]